MSTTRTSLGGMMESAQAGLAAGFASAAKAADDLQRSEGRTAPVDKVAISDEAQRLAAGLERGANLADGLVQLRRARQQILANLAVVETASDLDRSVAKLAK
ncbi:MAG: hypothetical protein EXR75_07005 [Myxococcales bacterium]|nr:hypothetical protein [Myxococcales bacterium]